MGVRLLANYRDNAHLPNVSVKLIFECQNERDFSFMVDIKIGNS
jgi:hypothetical protein